MNTGRNFRFALAAAALLGCAARLAPAQDAPPANPPAPPAVTNHGPARWGELAWFAVFLDRHPNIEARLRENPALVNDPAFQINHPAFAEFLARHPEISAELAARPRWFIHRELIKQAATPVTLAQVADFDRFLNQHPGIERQLAQHPQLLRNPEFLNRHPELHEYLKQHPEIDRAAESKPGRLMEREGRGEHAE
jgi:hypothetical protein